jgi:hypothetical protein
VQCDAERGDLKMRAIRALIIRWFSVISLWTVDLMLWLRESGGS